MDATLKCQVSVWISEGSHHSLNYNRMEGKKDLGILICFCWVEYQHADADNPLCYKKSMKQWKIVVAIINTIVE